MSFMKDQFQYIPAILCAGLVSDLLLWRLKPSSTRWTAFHLFTFLMPTVYYTFYFSALLLTKGIAWSIHLWMGSIILAGIVGLLLSHLMPMPLASMEQQARLGGYKAIGLGHRERCTTCRARLAQPETIARIVKRLCRNS